MGRLNGGIDAAARGSATRALLLLLIWPLAALLLGTMAADAQPRFPPAPSSPIYDEANLLGQSDRREILDMLAALEGKSTDQLVVFTTKSLQGYPIEDFGYQLGRAWGVGQKDKNNGIILIVAPNERKVRIEVGRGLEPIMTDLLSGLIVDNVILPAFRRGDFAGGIKAGVHDIRDALLGDAEEVKKRAAGGTKRSQSAGAGDDWVFILFLLAVIAYVVWSQYRESKRLPASARYRRDRGSGGIVVIPSGGSSGGWGGGWSGGSSGGGWSGGGGDFGGGGSSGSW